MRATLWHGTDELSALHRAILQEIFTTLDIPLEVVHTQAEMEAAAGQRRRAGGDHFLNIDGDSGQPSDVARCIAVGARTRLCLHAICPDEEMVRVIEQALDRPLTWLPSDFRLPLLVNKLHAFLAAPRDAGLEAEPARPALTPREREVQSLKLEGCTNAQIAARLCISAETVHTHLSNSRRKLGHLHGLDGANPVGAGCARTMARGIASGVRKNHPSRVIAISPPFVVE